MSLVSLLWSVLFTVPPASAGMPRTEVQKVEDNFEEIPAGQALIVFVRPWRYGPTQPFFLFDDEGHFVGEVPNRSRLHVFVPEGEHTFVGWHHGVFGDYGQASLVTGEVVAGRAYQIIINAWELPMQLISFPVGLSPCPIMEATLAAQRVGPDPQPDLTQFPQQKVASLIAGARRRFAARDKRDMVWTFHNVGGTFERFYVGSLREQMEELFGRPACRVLWEEGQQQLDLKEWKKSMKAADMRFEKVRE